MGKEMSASNIQLFSKLLTCMCLRHCDVVPETSGEHVVFILKSLKNIS
jgi:hypothetical protein